MAGRNDARVGHDDRHDAGSEGQGGWHLAGAGLVRPTQEQMPGSYPQGTTPDFAVGVLWFKGHCQRDRGSDPGFQLAFPIRAKSVIIVPGGPLRIVAWLTWSGRERSSHGY